MGELRQLLLIYGQVSFNQLQAADLSVDFVYPLTYLLLRRIIG